MLPTALEPLAAWPQFVAWKILMRPHPKTGAMVPTKVPFNPHTGKGASSTNPGDWGTYDQARQFADARGMDGVGFVFTERDPFFFGDVDKALVNGQWSQLAQELCARFAGAAIEVSQSGTGLHIIGRYDAPFLHRNKNIPLGLELYTKERFVALTGTNAVGSADTVHTPALAAVVQQYFNPADAAHSLSAEWTTQPCAEWKGPADDNTLIERALGSGGNSAASAFGSSSDRVSFAELWGGDVHALGAKWPSASGMPFDASSADQALANQLAFWTGRDCERIERLMRMSALSREKWDDRPDYLETTILKACSLVRSVYVGSTGEAVPPPPAPTEQEVKAAGFEVRPGGGIMPHYQQMEHFAGCVYVSGPHRVFTPRGELLDQGRFDAIYGGYEFVVGADGKKTTTSAWEAYTKSQTFRPAMADRLCFRPEHGAGGLVSDSGKVLANTYVPAKPDVTPGDATPFLNHMRKMLPHGDDLEILLSYMSSVVQNPGMKAQWWPIVQGAEGNFKSFLLIIMAAAVGTHYSHMPNMKKMVKGDSNFNGWIDRKLFLGLDEVYAADRRDFFEGFKTTVTNRFLAIEGKGLEEITGDNRANGMIVTNHQDGVPISGNGRRYAAFFCAQQTPDEMIRDGMNAEYIADLKDWLLGSGQYAHLGPNHGVRVMGSYLHTRVNEAKYDPAQLAVRCPETTSTAAAIASGRGRIEQEIMEAVEQGKPGFAGGWISSVFLDRMLKELRRDVPPSKRREVLQGLGYDWHPALSGNNGRVNNPVKPDDAKPRLFCKVGSIAWGNLTDAASVAKAYTKAQSDASSEVTASQFA